MALTEPSGPRTEIDLDCGHCGHYQFQEIHARADRTFDWHCDHCGYLNDGELPEPEQP